MALPIARPAPEATVQAPLTFQPGSEATSLIVSTPLETVERPWKVFVPERVSTPAPVLVRVPVPSRFAETIALPAVLLAA